MSGTHPCRCEVRGFMPNVVRYLYRTSICGSLQLTHTRHIADYRNVVDRRSCKTGESLTSFPEVLSRLLNLGTPDW